MIDTLWRLELLGCLKAVHRDRTVTRFRSQQTALLLAYLAFYSHRPHPRQELIDLLWPETDPEAGSVNLRVALSSLRRQLEPPDIPPRTILLADRATVQLNPAGVISDVVLFERALCAVGHASGSRPMSPAYKVRSAAASLERLVEAVDLYQGELLPGYHADWILLERRRLAEAYLRALHQLIALLEAAGQIERATQYARRAVAADPLQEESHHELMRLLVSAGQPEAALRQYRELEQLLQRELGAVPEADTRALVEVARQKKGAHARQGAIARAVADTGRQSEGARGFSASPLAFPAPDQVRRSAGTITFLLTEIVGAATWRERLGADFAAVSTSYHALLGPIICDHGGQPLRTTADSFLATFPRARDALAAAVALQQILSHHPWPEEIGALPVRMALHTADVALQEDCSQEPAFHHATRVLFAAHPGQILLSEATAVLLRSAGDSGQQFVELGRYRLRAGTAPESLFQVHLGGMLPTDFPPALAAPAHGGYLPLPFTRFFGREHELAQLQALLAPERTPGGSPPASDSRPRLVTLTGPGGGGKTRLALELARRLQEEYRGAIWFVPLADLADPGRLLDRLLDLLHLSRTPGGEPLEQVVTLLSAQECLLLLDNLEHLLEQGTSLVQILLERVPNLRLLVTSRQRLNLPGEREIAVLPLPIPDAHLVAQPDPVPGREARLASVLPSEVMSCASVRLFVDRAQAARPDFQVTERNSAAVAQLCARLEGLPLAIELAAARAQVLTPAQMLARLQSRFELLTGRRRAPDPRHQSLRATLDWSYTLLSPPLQRVFAQLSVFRGGWTLEAAEAVCGEPRALEYLEQLRDGSLVLTEEVPEGSVAAIRFHLLEMVREYGAEQLSPTDQADLRERHATYYLALAEQAETNLHGPDQVVWLDRLEQEHDNLRAALAWSVEAGRAPSRPEPVEIGLRLGASLWQFWHVRGYWTEGRHWLEQLLALGASSGRSVPRVRAVRAAGTLALHQGDYDAASSLLGEALAMAEEVGERQESAVVLNGLGHLAEQQRDFARARSLYERSLAIAQELEDRVGMAEALGELGGVARRHQDAATTQSLYEESLTVARELGDYRRIAGMLSRLGSLAAERGDRERAYEHLQEALALQQGLGDQWNAALSLHRLALLAYEQGDYPRSRTLHEQSLTVRRRLGDRHGVIQCLVHLANLALLEGDRSSAETLYEESLALRRAMGDPLDAAEVVGYLGRPPHDYSYPQLSRTLREQSLAICRGAGDVLGTAHVLRHLGNALVEQSNFDQARHCYQESLEICQAKGDLTCVSVLLGRLGNVARLQGDFRTARARYEEVLEIARHSSNRHGVAVALRELGMTAQAGGDYTQARCLYEEALGIERELGSQWWEAALLRNLGTLAQDEGDLGEASSLFERALSLFRAVDDRPDIASVLELLGHVALHQGNFSGARTRYQECLMIRRAIGYLPDVARSLAWLGTLAQIEGQAGAPAGAGDLRVAAARLFGAVVTLREAIGLPVWSGDGRFEALRGALGDAAFSNAWNAGQALTWEQAAAEALGEGEEQSPA